MSVLPPDVQWRALKEIGYFEKHNKMSPETKEKLEDITKQLDGIEEKVKATAEHTERLERKKVPWTSYAAIGVGVIGYITALMMIMYNMISQVNETVKGFYQLTADLSATQKIMNSELESIKNRQSSVDQTLNSMKLK